MNQLPWDDSYLIVQTFFTRCALNAYLFVRSKNDGIFNPPYFADPAEARF
jgi:hypothetical protein